MSETRSKDILLAKLPVSVQNVMRPSTEDSSSDRPFIFEFLKNALPSHTYDGEFMNVHRSKFNLCKWKKKQVRKPRLKKTALSLNEKRKLGLYALQREGLKYTDFLPLHNLWKEYITSYLDIEALEKLGFTATPDDRNWENFTRLLLKADYHGSFLTVQKSVCSSLVGRSGIVVLDTKNTFKLLGEDNILRTIPKESSVFCLKHRDYTFAILGKHFCMRPSDRSSKKIKTSMNLDL